MNISVETTNPESVNACYVQLVLDFLIEMHFIPSPFICKESSALFRQLKRSFFEQAARASTSAARAD